MLHESYLFTPSIFNKYFAVQYGSAGPPHLFSIIWICASFGNKLEIFFFSKLSHQVFLDPFFSNSAKMSYNTWWPISITVYFVSPLTKLILQVMATGAWIWVVWWLGCSLYRTRGEITQALANKSSVHSVHWTVMQAVWRCSVMHTLCGTYSVVDKMSFILASFLLILVWL